MKNITLGAMLFAGLSVAVAQNSVPVSNAVQGMKVAPNHKPIFDVNEKNRQAMQAATFHYWINWGSIKAQYEQDVNTVPASAFTYYVNGVFMDSTVQSSAATSTAHIFDNRVGTIIDPTSPFLDPNQGGTPLITNTDAYVIDSIILGGRYQRRNNINDTLLVEVCWGDTISSTVWSPVSTASPVRRWLMPKLNSSSSHGNKSFLTSPPANRVRIKYVLTPADTVGGNVYYLIDENMIKAANGGQLIKVGAGQKASISYTFVPGEAYNFGDVYYEYANPQSAATRNGYGAYLLGETASSPVGYFYDTPQNFNACAFFFNAGRYGKYSGGSAFLNSCMFPDAGSAYSWEILCSISNQTVGVKEVSGGALKVYQNTPNPANNNTFVNYDLKDNSNVSLTVYDMTGKQVMSIAEGTKSAGSHVISVNTENINAGVYFYTLTAGENSITRKMTIVK